LHPRAGSRPGENPFFDTLFAYLDFHAYNDLVSDSDFESTFEQKALQVSSQAVNNTFFNFIVQSSRNSLFLAIAYKSAQIDAELIAYIAEQFQQELVRMIHEGRSIIGEGAAGTSYEPAKPAFSDIDFTL
jgi:hypothetical protein